MGRGKRERGPLRVTTKDRSFEMGRMVLAIVALAEQLGEEAERGEVTTTATPGDTSRERSEDRGEIGVRPGSGGHGRSAA